MGKFVKVEGLKPLEVALRQLPDATARNVLRRVLKKAIQVFVDMAKNLAPEDEGVLKESIHAGTKLSRREKRRHRKVDPNDVEIHAGPAPLPQAIMQEFGTWFHSPQPYMRPAWSATKMKILNSIKGLLSTEIRKAAERLARKAARIAAKNKR